MKPPLHHSLHRPTTWATAVQAFTLAEMMTTVAIFSLVMIAMISLQIFGFKMNSFTSSKLKSTADSLKVLIQMRNQIRGAENPVVVGNYDTGNNEFTAVADDQPAIGNAVRISNSPTSLITFYLNTNTFILYELGVTANNQPTPLAHSLANPQPFQAVDYYGDTIAAGSSDRYTIKMTLLFSNLNYSVPTPTYDTYSLKTCATPRVQN